MKIHNKFIAFCLPAVLLFSACHKELLNPKPENLISDAAVFQDVSFARAFLNETYSGVPSGFERGCYMLDNATDIASTGYPWAYSHNWNRGDFSPTNLVYFDVPWDWNLQTQWQQNFNFIRRTNSILANIDKVPGDAAQKADIKGQSYFLRALFYHELVKLYGGVPIIKQPQAFTDTAKLYVPRNSFDECVTFIVSDLDSAAALLPATRSGADVGRATSTAALALKGRQLLFAGRWADAAKASLAAKNTPGYSLFANYEQMFWASNNNNNEMIFEKQYLSKAQNRVHSGNQWNSIPTHGGWGGTQPTQNLVDMYEMSDGLPYNLSPLYDANNPYANRDPRFDMTVLHDRSLWIGDSLKLYKGAFQGVHGSSNDATKTGYYLRKLIDPAIVGAGDLNNGYNNWPILRLAEVYLNYAEAQNEANGPDQSVYDAINAIRQRPSVNMPPLPTGLTQSQMRDRIHHERTIELAFEESHYYDLRRWKDASGAPLANSVLNQPTYGMLIDSTRKTYTRFQKEVLVYYPKNALLPIAQSEINKYGGRLQQNPGY